MIRKSLMSLAFVALLATPVIADDIMETAVGSGDLGMLATAVEHAGLVETLKGEGPFTLFAPNDNTAFMQVEEGGEFEQMLLDLPKLTSLLTYHVVPGIVMAADIQDGMTLTTLQGGELTFTLDGGAKVNGANIVKADVVASNGVVHIIDAILTPTE